jgi:hypothetical protein
MGHSWRNVSTFFRAEKCTDTICPSVLGLPQHVEQLADHLLEDDGIFGQRRRGVGEGNAGGGTDVRAHTLLDARRYQIIRCSFDGIEEMCGAQAVRLGTGR